MFCILCALVTLGVEDRQIKKLTQTHKASKRKSHKYIQFYLQHSAFSLRGLKRVKFKK